MSVTTLIAVAESGLLPDAAIRFGIRRLLADRLDDYYRLDPENRDAAHQELIANLAAAPIAVATDAANDQHYELPAAFFCEVLGPNLKYSSGLWPDGVDDLATAEEAMLRLTCERARIGDDMDVLDLGCGWGSLSLWIARAFPTSRVLAVSNSHGQASHIAARCRAEKINNLEVITADMRDFVTARRFDRIVSVEMFEHMRNWRLALDRVASWLGPEGLVFLHVFSHREFAYLFEDQGPSDWMARHFFTGGLMPSEDLPDAVGSRLRVEQQWRVDGQHYSRTLESWLERLDLNRRELRPLFEQVYGSNARRWLQRWRMFFIACSELFAFDRGREWGVSHYLLAHSNVAAAHPASMEPAA